MVTVVTGEFSKFRAFCETSPWMIFIYMILDILVSWQRQMHLNFSRKKQQSICHLFSFSSFSSSWSQSPAYLQSLSASVGPLLWPWTGKPCPFCLDLDFLFVFRL